MSNDTPAKSPSERRPSSSPDTSDPYAKLDPYTAAEEARSDMLVRVGREISEKKKAGG